ncbi:hypothetical protein INT47_008930 [Mucor saturninus]|uniref:START domain-containing protein n=1 Tax=Mucor saturninus TaxID=64648 RepID=A0A8H7V4B8_9FUNG|nr:hypothetical protein INT47_008930 [Mucor saturninus]
MTVTNPHAETSKNALALLKSLSSNLDGWNFTQEKDGVKLYNKTVDSSPVAIVRGDTSIVGHEFTPQQIASVATLPGARKIWDEKFDSSDIKQMYSRLESLFWAKVKTPWPISPRDMCSTSLREISEDECYVVMNSVEDAAIPPVSGFVRANLIISGWKVLKTDTGINLTYITQIDLAGSIPTAFLKSVQQQVPLCAGSVVKYAQTYGYPPTTATCTATFKSENFEHAKKTYTASLDGTGECSWLISKKMYPSGTKVAITGEAKHELSEDRLVLTEINGPVTVTITKA